MCKISSAVVLVFLLAMASASPIGETMSKGRIRKVKVAKPKDGTKKGEDGKFARNGEKMPKLGNLDDWGWFFNVNNPLRVHVNTMEVWDRLTGWDTPKRKLDQKNLQLKELELATASIKYRQAKEEYSQVLSNRMDHNVNYSNDNNYNQASYTLSDGTTGNVQYFTKRR